MKQKIDGMNIIIMGPQASGKGTQAEMLSKKLSIPHISTGDIFRDMKNQNTPLAKKVIEIMKSGKLVPDEITNKVIEKRLEKEDLVHGFILDGYPRDISQANFLDSKKEISICILIHLSDQEAIRRITARRICPNCRENYNVLFLKPKKEGVCNKCNTKLIVREDDNPEAIKQRLKKYHQETEPVLNHYKKKGVLIEINGNQEIPLVFSDLLAALKI